MISETIMVPATSQITLTEGVPRSLIKAMNLTRFGYAHLVVTDDAHMNGGLTDTAIFGRARWTGVLRYMDNGLRTLHCETPDILLGDQDGKAGFVWHAADFSATQDFEAHLDDYLAVSNGLTKGQVLDATATTFKVKAISGVTPRDQFMAALRHAPGGPFEYRVNPDFTVDTGRRSSLSLIGAADSEAITTQGGSLLITEAGDTIVTESADGTPPTPVVVTAEPGGRTGAVVGLQAPGLRVESRDIRDWRNHQYDDWEDTHTLIGEATSTVPAGYRAADGTLLEIAAMDGTNIQTNRNLRNWARINANLLDAQADADDDAAAILDANNDVREQIVIEVDVDDPHRFMRPGDTIYAYNPAGNIYDLTAEPVQYRGRPIFPRAIRFTGWDWPLKRGRHRVFYHSWVSGAWRWLEVTRWLAWEDGPVRLQIGARRRSTVQR